MYAKNKKWQIMRYGICLFGLIFLFILFVVLVVLEAEFWLYFHFVHLLFYLQSRVLNFAAFRAARGSREGQRPAVPPSALLHVS